jgi:hypothetical protein
MKSIFAIVLVALLLGTGSLSIAQAKAAKNSAKISMEGDSQLTGVVSGKSVRIVVTAYKIDIGTPSQTPPSERDNNCTYSRFPCAQVKTLRIWVNGVQLRVPKSSYLDCADLGSMNIDAKAENIVLTLVGGDASEGYSVKIVFDSHRVKQRSVYWTEGNDALLETTTYMPPIVLN